MEISNLRIKNIITYVTHWKHVNPLNIKRYRSVGHTESIFQDKITTQLEVFHDSNANKIRYMNEGCFILKKLA